MALSEKDKEEIQALVAAEIQQVLRREMAQWWAESTMALSGYPPRERSQWGGSPDETETAGQKKIKTQKKKIQPKKLGRSHPVKTLGQKMCGSPPLNEGMNEDHLVRIIEALIRSQEHLAQELKECLERIENETGSAFPWPG